MIVPCTFVIFFVTLVISKPFLYENDICGKEEENATISICKRLDACPIAKKQLQQGIFPKTCGFIGEEVVVCCEQHVSADLASFRKKQYSTAGNMSDGIVFEKPISIKTKSEKVCELGCQIAQRIEKEKQYTFHFVVSGTAAAPKQYPHMALVGFGEKSDIKWRCGGSLISERFVLSAAHCSEPASGVARWIRLGELDISSTKDDGSVVEFEIIERIVHPGYNPASYYNDVALFKLDKEVTFNEYVRPICLNSNSDVNGVVIAAGWGQTGVGYPTSSHLMAVSIHIISNDKCVKNYGNSSQYVHGIDSKTMIYAADNSGGDKDTCQGDSGGPLMKNIYSKDCGESRIHSQVGITSFGRSCGEPDSPGVYTRVSHYVPWIEDIVWS